MSVSLMDAHDLIMSDLTSEISQMRLSYLLTKGLGNDETRLKEQLIEGGVIVADSDGDAEFISREIKTEAVKLAIDKLRQLIFEGAASYDPSAFVEGGTPPTAYQVSERLQPLEMDCEVTIAEWAKGYRLLDYALQTYLIMFHGVEEYPLWEIERIFRRVAPRNTLQALTDAKNAGMALSNQTMIELSGLQIDGAVEEERLAAQKEAGLIDVSNGAVGPAENNTSGQVWE
jgi:hypothetical protein